MLSRYCLVSQKKGLDVLDFWFRISDDVGTRPPLPTVLLLSDVHSPKNKTDELFLLRNERRDYEDGSV